MLIEESRQSVSLGSLFGNLQDYPGRATGAATVLVGAIALADYATGYELRLAVLYLLPVFLATWVAGWLSGAFIALLSSLSWLVIFRSSHPYSKAIYYYWEGAILFGTLLVFVMILARLRRALERADERFVTVLEGLDAGVYVSETDTGSMLYTNRRFRDFFGAGSAAMNANEFEQAFGVVPADFLAGIALTQSESAPVRGEFQDRQKGRWFLVNARSIRWTSGRKVSLKVLTDITESKQAEQASRLQIEKLQMSSKLLAIAEMASALSHELNQPLTAIASYNQACVRLLRGDNPDTGELLRVMEKCGVQAVRAGSIINRMREFVRKREPVRNVHELNAVIKEAVQLIETEAAKNQVELLLDLTPELPLVLVDTIMIEQVLLNLIRNSIEAMQQAKSDTRKVTVTSKRAEDDMVLVSLQDSGPGIPSELEASLYTPFFSTKEGGMGIGLNISRSIVEFHGGKLWHEPCSGRGTVFHLTLPVASA